MRKNEYLDIVQEQIRCRQARDGVRRELEGHIEEQMECYQSQGIASREAEEMAVRDMGDPVETGNAMDRIHRPKMAWKSIGVIVGISLATFILQYILRNSAPERVIYSGSWIPGGAPRYLMMHIAGWGVMIGVCYLDYTRIGKYAVQLMILGCVGIKLLEVFFAAPVNGAVFWIFAGQSISIQMVMFLFLPIYGAVLYRYRGQGYQGVAAGMLWILPSFIMILSENGLLVGLIIGITYMVMLTVAIRKDWFVVSKKITIAVLWSVLLLLAYFGLSYIKYQGAPYQTARLAVLLDPYSTEAGYMTMVMRKLLSGSRLLGTKAGFMGDSEVIPDTGDYTLSLICAYYGVFVTVVLIVSILLLVLYFVRMSLRQKNQLGMIMGTGCSVVFLVELLLYIMGNIGRLPGVSYCPFLGYGGTGIMITYILLGILLSVYRYEHVAAEVKIEKTVYVRQEEG